MSDSEDKTLQTLVNILKAESKKSGALRLEELTSIAKTKEISASKVRRTIEANTKSNYPRIHIFKVYPGGNHEKPASAVYCFLNVNDFTKRVFHDIALGHIDLKQQAEAATKHSEEIRLLLDAVMSALPSPSISVDERNYHDGHVRLLDLRIEGQNISVEHLYEHREFKEILDELEEYKALYNRLEQLKSDLCSKIKRTAMDALGDYKDRLMIEDGCILSAYACLVNPLDDLNFKTFESKPIAISSSAYLSHPDWGERAYFRKIEPAGHEITIDNVNKTKDKVITAIQGAKFGEEVPEIINLKEQADGVRRTIMTNLIRLKGRPIFSSCSLTPH